MEINREITGNQKEDGETSREVIRELQRRHGICVLMLAMSSVM
jgi:hypothetical protein